MLQTVINRFLVKIKCSANVSIGKNTFIKPRDLVIGRNAKGKISLGEHSVCRAQLYSFLDQGRIEIGDYCFLGQNSKIWALERVTIGNRVMISHNCFIVDNLTHPLGPAERHAQYLGKIGLGKKTETDLQPAPVTIEDDAWLGANAILLPGVHVGRGAVIGAGAVVTSEIPPRVLAVGNPARVVKKL
jgi:acetyltransferase-like isoleucine patch superfamily enzyme